MLLFMLTYIFRVIKGPSHWDRVLAVNLVFSKIIMIIITFASINETAYLLDFAIIYTLSGFIGTIFLVIFLAKRSERKHKHEHLQNHQVKQSRENQGELD
jgi:multicomponent Na+:H+ antiporter subunit F